MDTHLFLAGTLSFLSLLTISSFTYLLAKKIHFPYTVLLVIVGLLLVPLSHIEIFSFINVFKLTPEILFFVFLPVLLFEAAYNINYRELLKNWKAIFTLAVFGLFFAAFSIAGLLFFLLPFVGFQVPFLVCLLFGILISATDPVAVLALFKNIGAPRRLALLFEGESLFNDGTALALFLVVLGIILEGGIVTNATFATGLGAFLSMSIGGVIFGGVTGVLFSKIIGKIKNNEMVEITLTMILAHITFLLAEVMTHYVMIGGWDLQVSGVIATAISGIIIGNYGRYKITPRVEHHMERFWAFFAFISNSIVFILIGLILAEIPVSLTGFILPSLLVILVVVLVRALSIYFPLGILNALKVEEKIPMNWQHLLSWGSLRGALALMLVLLVPGEGQEGFEKMQAFEMAIGWNYDFSIKDFLLIITVFCIMFTLLIKATTLGHLMRKFGVNKLHALEEFEYDEGKILANIKILEKLKKYHEKKYINKSVYSGLKQKYNIRLKSAVKDMKKLLKETDLDAKDLIKRAISLHALGIEKKQLKVLFELNEIDEGNFKIIFHKIIRQIERLEESQPQLRGGNKDENDYDFFEKMVMCVRKERKNIEDKYIRNRAKLIITKQVIENLEEMRKNDFGFNDAVFQEVIDMYQSFFEVAKKKKLKIEKEQRKTVDGLESCLIGKTLLNVEENILKDLYHKEIITPKLYMKFMNEIEEEVYKDIK